jgi:hypothetical protein
VHVGSIPHVRASKRIDYPSNCQVLPSSIRVIGGSHAPRFFHRAEERLHRKVDFFFGELESVLSRGVPGLPCPARFRLCFFHAARMKGVQLIGEKLRLFKSEVDVDLKV